jgi:RNA polymerase sigma-70 factor (ECF subfamily)
MHKPVAQDRKDDEARLVEALRRRDVGSFELLVRRYGARMLATGRRILRDAQLAEDCVQETFIKAFDKFDTFEGRSGLGTWLHSIMVNQALMKLRKDRAGRLEQIDDLMPQFDSDACRIEAPWSRLATPDELLERQQSRDLVRSQIEQLPENYRIVLQLRDIEEHDTATVAKILNLSEGAVKVRLHRARSALKALLEPLLRGEDIP